MTKCLQPAEENLEMLKAVMHKQYLILKWKQSETSISIPPHETHCLKIQTRLSPCPEGNKNPTPLAKGHTKDNPQNKDKKFNYIKYYLNVVP
jgi:hypothetical protein